MIRPRTIHRNQFGRLRRRVMLHLLLRGRYILFILSSATRSRKPPPRFFPVDYSTSYHLLSSPPLAQHPRRATEGANSMNQSPGNDPLSIIAFGGLRSVPDRSRAKGAVGPGWGSPLPQIR